MIGKEWSYLQSSQTDSQCTHCTKKFSSEGNLKCHIQKLHGGLEIQEEQLCEYCKKVFQTRTNFEKHMTIYHPEPKQSTNEINKKHSEQEVKIEQADKPIASNRKVVEINESSNKNLLKSIVVDDNKNIETKKVKCPICERDFTNSRGMKSHITKMHVNKSKCIVTGDGLRKICGQKFVKQKAVVYHEKICKNTKGVINKNTTKLLEAMLDSEKSNRKKSYNNCELCDMKFTANSKIESIQQVIEHKATYHPVDIEKYRDKKNCEDCDFEADNESMLKKHIRDFHGIWDFTRSTSPPPKRKKEYLTDTVVGNDQEKDETIKSVVEDLISEMEEMDLDEEKERMKNMDKKVLEKRKGMIRKKRIGNNQY